MVFSLRRAVSQVRLAARGARRLGRPSAAPYRPRLEWLESRTLLSFGPAVNYLTGPAGAATGPTFVLPGLFNADNNLDVAVANGGSNTVTVLTGNGNGTLNAPASATAVGIHPIFLAAGKLNGDANLDLVVADNGQLLTQEGSNAGDVRVLLGNGDGTFRAGPAFPAVGPSPGYLVLADLNHDGASDLVVVSTGDPYNPAGPRQGSVAVFLGNGAGGFSSSQLITLTGAFTYSFPTSAAVADFDGDGVPDLAVAAETATVNVFTHQVTYSSTLQIFRGRGDGTFTTPPAYTTTVGSYPSALVTGQFNGDGRTDLVVVNNNHDGTGSNTVQVLLNQSSPGAVNFISGLGSLIVVGSHPLFAAVGRFNGDANDDLAVTNGGTQAAPGSTVSVLLGQGTGGFAADPNSPYTVGLNPSGIAAGVFTSSGLQDLVVANTGSNTVSVLLNQLGTTTGLSVSPSPAAYGQAVTLTATVSATTGSATPGGAVVFRDGAATLGSATLSGGTATYTTAAFQLAVGGHSLTAVYQGDAGHSGSTSAVQGETVNPAATTTSLAASPNPSAYGQAVTLTATVQVTGAGSGTPTGTVTFQDGGVSLGRGTLAGGTATYTTTAFQLAVGGHSLTAVYATDGNYSGSTSPAAGQTVTGIATSTSVTSSANPQLAGQAVTFTATVTNPGGSGVPTGSVEFFDGTTDLGPGVAQGGSGASAAWTFTTAGLAVGTHTIEADYRHTGTFQDSSGTVSQTIGNALNAAAAPEIVTTAGASFTGVAASFTDLVPGAVASDLTATIDWGDGRSSSGGVAANRSGGFDVTGSHTYAAEGRYTVSVSIHDNHGDSATSANTAHVARTTPPPPGPIMVAIAYGLTNSAEYYTNFVTSAYQTYLHRDPDAQGLAGWVQGMLGGITDEQLEAYFIGSAEYIASKGAGPGNWAPWVESMYLDLLGRTPTQQEVDQWVAGLNAGISTTYVAHGFAASAERETLRVTADYEKYLGRMPTADEVNQWVQGFEGGLRNEYVIAGFVGSAEYFLKHYNDAVDWLFSAYQDALGRDPDPISLQTDLQELGS